MLKLLFVLLTIGLGVERSFAQSGFAPNEPVVAADPQAEKTIKAKRVKRTFLEIGGELRSYTYEEPGFVKHSGLMPGIWGNYVRKLNWGTVGVNSNFSFSNSNKYEGGLCETDGLGNTTCTPYETNKQTDIISKTSGLFYFSASEVLSFNAGLGYRYLSNSVPEPGFYLRTGSWFYLPVGFDILYNSDPVFKWKYEATFDYIISGGIKSNLSNVASKYSDVFMPQTGYGLNTNIQLRYRNRYIFSFFYETWTMDISESVVAAPGEPFHEPANKATSLGLRFGYDFY